MKTYTTLLYCILAGLFNNCMGQGNVGIGNTVAALDKVIFVVFQAKDNTYWFGSDGQGVYRYDGKSIIHFSTKDGLCNDRVREIKEDKEGNIYINTLDGISRYDGRRFATLAVVESNDWKLQPDDLWFTCNQETNGPYRYDGKNLYHLKFPKHEMEDAFYKNLPNAPYNPYQVYYLYKDSNGSIWFGTSSFGICRYNGKALSWMYEDHLTHIGTDGSFGIRSIIEDKAGKFWFCNTRYRYQIKKNEKQKGLIDYKREAGTGAIKSPDGKDHIYYMSVAEDNKHNLWMVTYRHGVWRYDGKKVTQYPVKDGAKEIKLFSVYKDNRGDLWLGTHEAGAYKWNGSMFEQFRP